jgi:hypothetical protein
MHDLLLTKKDLAKRWQQTTVTIDRYRKLGSLPWLDLTGGKGIKPIVRFRLSDIEEYEDKLRMHAMGSSKKNKPGNLSLPLSLSDKRPKLIRRLHGSK